MNEVPHVYTCITAVSAEIAKEGIAKTRNNQQQGYKFRGIDDVYNALAPLISKHGLVIVPRILSRELVERQTKTGNTLFNVTVEAEFDFVSAKDGSKVTARSFGEAMDSADKATNKAMSAAYKYTAFQTFCIPTEGDNDADAHTPEPTSEAAQPEPEHVSQLRASLNMPKRPAPPPTPPERRAAESGHSASLLISEAQAKRYYAIAKGVGWPDDALHSWLFDNYGYKSSKEIPRNRYEEICEAVKEGRV